MPLTAPSPGPQSRGCRQEVTGCCAGDGSLPGHRGRKCGAPPLYRACPIIGRWDEPRVPGRCPSPRAGRGACWVPRAEPQDHSRELGPRPSAGTQVERPLPSVFTSNYWPLPLSATCGDPETAGPSIPRHPGFPGRMCSLGNVPGAPPSPHSVPLLPVSVWSGGTRWHTREQAFSSNTRVAGVLSCMPQTPGSEVPRGGEGGQEICTPPPWPASF